MKVLIRETSYFSFQLTIPKELSIYYNAKIVGACIWDSYEPYKLTSGYNCEWVSVILDMTILHIDEDLLNIPHEFYFKMYSSQFVAKVIGLDITPNPLYIKLGDYILI